MVVLSAVVCTLNFVFAGHSMVSYLERGWKADLVVAFSNLIAGAFILAVNLV
jgi:hypothetical protein